MPWTVRPSLVVATTRRAPNRTIDGARLLKDLETLAADMEGRLPGTPGSAKARAYIVQRLKEAGIQPIGIRTSVPSPSGAAATPAIAVASTSWASFR